ncbi:MAG TPA: FecR domain-containing protein [Polyangia bacterium]|nr:FecR domain-containing protein [Polyangia bacterium]
MQRRVWARVSDPARTRRVTRNAFLRGALAASALTAVTVFAVERVQVGGPARPTALGPAEHAASDATTGAAAPTPQGQQLAVVAAAGAVVETGAGERLVRVLPRGARAELAPRTAVAVDEQGRPELRHGEVRFHVAPSAGGVDAKFSVRVASYRVVVAGARFVVKAEAQSISVAVEDGEAEIWNGSHVVRIGAGETWSSDAAAETAKRAGAPRASRERSPALAPVGETDSQVAEQDREDLAAARAARAASDPRRALALYEHLASRSGPAAENALYEIGGIYHDQLKQPAKAVAAWDRYRARYPNGLLRAEADLSVIDTLATLDGSEVGSRTLNEALAFLKRYPHSERRGEVSRVVGDLYRERGNYRAALDFYRAVPAAAGGADADDAAFGQAACLYALRDDGADAALRAYLAQRPHGRHARDAARLLGGASGGHDKETP